MIKSIIHILKRIIFSSLFLYSFNLISSKFNIIIPINIYTISILTLFDTPGFIGLIIFYLINFR